MDGWEIMDNRRYYADLWWRALGGDPEARAEVAADADGSMPLTESYVGTDDFWESLEWMHAFVEDCEEAAEGGNERAAYVANMIDRIADNGERMVMGLRPALPDPPFYGPPTTRAQVRAIWRWHKDHGIPPASGGHEERAAVARYRAEQSAIDSLIRDSGCEPPPEGGPA